MSTKTMIGELVTMGYMVSTHEGNVYLHTSQGTRWAEIDPFAMTLVVSAKVGDRKGSTSKWMTFADITRTLDEVE